MADHGPPDQRHAQCTLMDDENDKYTCIPYSVVEKQ